MDKNLVNFCKMHFNEPMLCMFDVARLIGVGQDECDSYYILHYPGNRGVVWSSAVGHLFPLSGLGKNAFTLLDSWLSLNGAPQAKKFLNLREPHEN